LVSPLTTSAAPAFSYHLPISLRENYKEPVNGHFDDGTYKIFQKNWRKNLIRMRIARQTVEMKLSVKETVFVLGNTYFMQLFEFEN